MLGQSEKQTQTNKKDKDKELIQRFAIEKNRNKQTIREDLTLVKNVKQLQMSVISTISQVD